MLTLPNFKSHRRLASTLLIMKIPRGVFQIPVYHDTTLNQLFTIFKERRGGWRGLPNNKKKLLSIDRNVLSYRKNLRNKRLTGKISYFFVVKKIIRRKKRREGDWNAPPQQYTNLSDVNHCVFHTWRNAWPTLKL